MGGERGHEVRGAVVGADEGVPEECVGTGGGREGERREPGAPRGGVRGDELCGEVGALGEARGDRERVKTEELGHQPGRRRREETGEDGERGRGLGRRHLIACSNSSFEQTTYIYSPVHATLSQEFRNRSSKEKNSEISHIYIPFLQNERSSCFLKSQRFLTLINYIYNNININNI